MKKNKVDSKVRVYEKYRSNLVMVRARVPVTLKEQVEAKMLAIKARGSKITWQMIIEDAFFDFINDQ